MSSKKVKERKAMKYIKSRVHRLCVVTEWQDGEPYDFKPCKSLSAARRIRKAMSTPEFKPAIVSQNIVYYVVIPEERK